MKRATIADLEHMRERCQGLQGAIGRTIGLHDEERFVEYFAEQALPAIDELRKTAERILNRERKALGASEK